jgi:hypothetical protein
MAGPGETLGSPWPLLVIRPCSREDGRGTGGIGRVTQALEEVRLMEGEKGLWPMSYGGDQGGRGCVGGGRGEVNMRGVGKSYAGGRV